MNLFEEDFTHFMDKAEGYNNLPADAKTGLRTIAFAMWVKGVTRAQTAQASGGMLKLAESMLEEIQTTLREEPLQ